MGLLGNGFRHNLTGRITAATTALDGCNASVIPAARNLTAMRRNMLQGEGIASPVASMPSGARNPVAWLLARKPGAIASRNNARITLGATGAGSMGKNTSGTASITFNLSGVGGLISSASGTASISLSASGNIFAAKYTSGSAGITLGATGAVKALGHTGGTAGVTLGANWTPYAVGWLSGTTAEAGLTPTGIASAVWNSAAASYNAAGTMGEKLNGAGSAGNPWTEVIESGLTAAEVMRIIAAALAGKSEKTETTIVFKGLDGTTDRITGEFDAEGNRTGVVLNGD